MIGIYIFWGVMTILSFSLWFIARAAWIQDTPDKNKCFWVCLVGTILIQFLLFAAVDTVRPKTTLPTEKVKIIINSNIPIMKHIVLISHNGENSWESFSTKEDALRYMDYLKNQYYNDIIVIYAIIP